MSPSQYFHLFFFLSRGILFLYLLFSGLGLLPDEAQYWTWSRYLQSGYYSKPPGIAYQVAISEFLFDKIGFDIAPRVLSFSLFPYLSALFLQKSLLLVTKNIRFSYLMAILYLLSPLGLFGSLFVTTDGAVMAVSCIIFFLLLKMQDEHGLQKNRYAVYAALLIAAGSLWKWTIFLLIPILFYEYIQQSGIKKRTFIILMQISFLGLIFPLLWNKEHNWVTFRHVGASLFSFSHSSQSGYQGAPFEFFLASTGLISFGYCCIGIYGIYRIVFSFPVSIEISYKRPLRVFALFALLIWGVLFVSSFYQKIQGNWALITMPSFYLLIGVGLFSCEYVTQKRVVFCTTILSLLIQCAIFGMHFSGCPHLVLKSPLKQGFGLMQIAASLKRVGYNQESMFLISDRYQNVAQLERYSPNMPSTVYFMNLWNIRMNEYSFRLFEKEKWLHRSGFFIAILPEREIDMIDMRVQKYITALSPYFERVVYCGAESLTTRSWVSVRRLLLFHCDSYNGTPFPYLLQSESVSF